MPGLDLITRRTLEDIAATIRGARRARGWSQRRLAAASGHSQPIIGRIERAQMPGLSFRTALRVLRALGVEPDMRFVAPRVETPPVRDRAHARCVSMVARRLLRAGCLVATEVEVGGARWLGFVDVLALDPVRGLLLIIEVKTELHDIGAVDRQLNSYLEASWAAARARRWRPRAATGVLLLLATDETDRRIQEHRSYLARAFPLRGRALADVFSGSSGTLPERGVRGLALIDPAARRRNWLIASQMDGRRSQLRYANRSAFLARSG